MNLRAVYAAGLLSLAVALPGRAAPATAAVPAPVPAPAPAPVSVSAPVPAPAAAPVRVPAPAPAPTAAAADAAVAARKAGRFDEAFALLQTRLAAAPADARAQHELGVLYALHGQGTDAERAFLAALAAEPELAESRRALAEVLRGDGRCSQALPHLQQLLVADLRDAAALRGLVLCHQATGQLERAIGVCDDVQERFSGTEFAGWAAGRKALLAHLHAAGQVTPEQAEAEGKALFAEKRFVDAAVWLDIALQVAPTADRAYRLAMAHLGAGDALAALGALGRALRIEPTHLASRSAWPTIAKAVRARGAGGADVAFGTAPGTPAQRVARALIEGDLVLARQLLAPALAADLQLAAAQRSPLLLVLHGEVQLREGRLAAAAQAFLDALAMRPNYPPATKGLADVYVQQGRGGGARELLRWPAPAPHDAEGDLQRFVRKRRAEFHHQLRMSLDPGIKPLPSLLDQVADAAPPPPPPPPAPVEVAEPPAKVAPGKARTGKAPSSRKKSGK